MVMRSKANSFNFLPGQPIQRGTRMNRPALTVLGGSVSLAFIVLTGNPAHALMPPELRGDGGSRVNGQTVRQPILQEEVPQSAQATNARIKQLAQGTFGCTCTTCMNTVRQMIQQGQL